MVRVFIRFCAPFLATAKLKRVFLLPIKLSEKVYLGGEENQITFAVTLLCCKFSDFNAFISVSNDFFNDWGPLDCYLWLCSELLFYQALQRLLMHT